MCSLIEVFLCKWWVYYYAVYCADFCESSSAPSVHSARLVFCVFLMSEIGPPLHPPIHSLHQPFLQTSPDSHYPYLKMTIHSHYLSTEWMAE